MAGNAHGTASRPLADQVRLGTQMSTDTDLEIHCRGQRTRLKWHQLRKSVGDPVFDLNVMKSGFALGASMELDLRMRGDGGFAVLHDDRLENETTGEGHIGEIGAADLVGIRYRTSGAPVITSEMLSSALGEAHPDALLQFDIKDTLSVLGEAGLRQIADSVGPHAGKIIISSLDLDLMVAARETVPHIARGIDPTDEMTAAFAAGGMSALVDTLTRALAGPTDAGTVYLHWPMILDADTAGHDLIGMCHAAGKIVDAWTFNLKDEDQGFDAQEWLAFSRLMDLGPDQVTTDGAPSLARASRSRSAC